MGAFVVHFQDMMQIFIMIIGQAVAKIINIAAQDGMCQRVAFGTDFPAAEQEFL